MKAKREAARNKPGTFAQGTGFVPTPIALPEMPFFDNLPPTSDAPSILDGKFEVRTPQQRKLDEIRTIVGELTKREREALKLYQPLPLQVAFHASMTKTRLLRGSTRSGKTLMAAVELARAVLGCDPHRKYPKRGTIYVVGYDWSHHGTVTYPKLFLPGAFKCIEDEATGLLRAYRPWLPQDSIRRAEVVDAEPLIPERYVDSISWYKKKESIPNLVKLTTGWEMHFFSGDGRPPRGQAVDIAWLDEEIGNQFWYNEMVSRTADLDGRIIWSAAPQSGTEQLYELHEHAGMQRDDPDRVVEEFHVRVDDNPHLTQKQKSELLAGLTTEMARVTQYEGEFPFTTQRVFGEYSVLIHGLVIDTIPDHWTRYAVIDPGHAICAVLFAACPPPDEQSEFGKVVLYDELYIAKCSAAVLAEKMRGKTAGHRFRDFIIDLRAGRQTSATTGKTTAQHYTEEFQKSGVACLLRGSGFCWGSDDVTGRIEAVRGLLKIGGDNVPSLRVACELTQNGSRMSKLQNFEYEVARYRYKRDAKTGIVTDTPEDKGRVHLQHCLQYLAAYQPKWFEQPPMERADSAVYRQFQKKQRQNAQMQGGQQIGIRLGVGRES